jgi:hypothetical protein
MLLPDSEWSLIGFTNPTVKGKKVKAVFQHKLTGLRKSLHFGQKGSSTYWNKTGVSTEDPTHGDAKIRANYRLRHAGSADRKWSPAYLSWTLLW